MMRTELIMLEENKRAFPLQYYETRQLNISASEVCMFIFLVYPCRLLHKSFSAHIPTLPTNLYKSNIFPCQLLPYALVHLRSSFPSLCTICLQLYALTNYNIHFHTYSIPFLSNFAFFFFRFSFTLFLGLYH